ncbi:unnamed protein product [Miscanthus lutarioriparius]|uniref:Amino acid transporter transmembrane domain-containing protein n=1 Tax=Miscanthus lutarioriparius TaxID=422564 RepID=A0A811RRV1_9POAL|nr:unnamed protein product [Miscanthus lutarioriparius]
MEQYAETARERTQEDKTKNVNDWLPITSSRTAKWYYSAFHNVTAMVGDGVLGLPFAMSQLGWGLGTVVIVMSFVITLYTLWQMVEMHKMIPGKRFDRYHELGQHAFGERLGLWIIVPQQLIVEVGTDIVYMVIGGQGRCKDIRLTYWIIIFGSVHFPLSQFPNFNSISAVSAAAAVMSLTYSMIAFVTSVVKGAEEATAGAIDYGLRANTTSGRVFGVLNGLGAVAFAYAGHNVVLEIQATIPSTPEKPSKKPMWLGVVVGYFCVALCYFCVAFAGYYAFGNSVEPNVLISLEKPRWLIAAARQPHGRRPRRRQLPGVRHACVRHDRDRARQEAQVHPGDPPELDRSLRLCRSLASSGSYCASQSWFINIICIVIGVLLTLISPIGGLRQIILDAKSFKLYS